MKNLRLQSLFTIFAFIIFGFSSVFAQINERNVRAHMDFLAGDAMQGRGSGTQFEWISGQYFASMMQQFGIEPAGESDSSGNKTYLQTINIAQNSFSKPPIMIFNSGGADSVLEHGKEMIVLRIGSSNISGEFQIIGYDEKPKPGAVAFVKVREGDDPAKVSQSIGSLMGSGAAAIILEETEQWRSRWSNTAARKITYSTISNSAESSCRSDRRQHRHCKGDQ